MATNRVYDFVGHCGPHGAECGGLRLQRTNQAPEGLAMEVIDRLPIGAHRSLMVFLPVREDLFQPLEVSNEIVERAFLGEILGGCVHGVRTLRVLQVFEEKRLEHAAEESADACRPER